MTIVVKVTTTTNHPNQFGATAATDAMTGDGHLSGADVAEGGMDIFQSLLAYSGQPRSTPDLTSIAIKYSAGFFQRLTFAFTDKEDYHQFFSVTSLRVSNNSFSALVSSIKAMQRLRIC